MNGNFGNRRNDNFKPVNIGEEISVEIEATGEKGDGICKRKGFVLFVPNAKQGDRVKIRITKVLNKVGFAEVIGKADESELIKENEPKARESMPPPPEPEPIPEDSEDFGEEPSEELDDSDSTDEDTKKEDSDSLKEELPEQESELIEKESEQSEENKDKEDK
jgi:predicted RNA-binding protein with TRAM domain